MTLDAEDLELQELPREAAPLQILDHTLRKYGLRKAEIDGIKNYQGILKERVDYLESRQKEDRGQVDLMMTTMNLDKHKTLGVASVYYQNRSATLTVTDEDAAIAWAEENAPGLIVIKKTIDRTQLKELALDRMKETGEILPGLDYQPASRSLVIREAK
jgi:hypothetical protein